MIQGRAEEIKKHIFTAFDDWVKRLEACLLHNIDVAVVSECVCHLKVRYLVQSSNMIG